MVERSLCVREVIGSIPIDSIPEVSMAEWLRRWTANPLGSARAGSNPVRYVFRTYSSAVEQSTADRSVPGSNPGESFVYSRTLE